MPAINPQAARVTTSGTVASLPPPMMSKGPQSAVGFTWAGVFWASVL